MRENYTVEIKRNSRVSVGVPGYLGQPEQVEYMSGHSFNAGL